MSLKNGPDSIQNTVEEPIVIGPDEIKEDSPDSRRSTIQSPVPPASDPAPDTEQELLDTQLSRKIFGPARTSNMKPIARDSGPSRPRASKPRASKPRSSQPNPNNIPTKQDRQSTPRQGTTEEPVSSTIENTRKGIGITAYISGVLVGSALAGTTVYCWQTGKSPLDLFDEETTSQTAPSTTAPIDYPNPDSTVDGGYKNPSDHENISSQEWLALAELSKTENPHADSDELKQLIETSPALQATPEDFAKISEHGRTSNIGSLYLDLDDVWQPIETREKDIHQPIVLMATEIPNILSQRNKIIFHGGFPPKAAVLLDTQESEKVLYALYDTQFIKDYAKDSLLGDKVKQGVYAPMKILDTTGKNTAYSRSLKLFPPEVE